MENLLNTLFPPKCFNCGLNYGYICAECLEECPLAKHFYCVVCDKPSVMGETHLLCAGIGAPLSIYSAYEYKGIVRKCIMKAKYRSRLFAPLKIIVAEATQLASKCDLDYLNHIVTTIPLSKQKERMRGFNQAGLISQAVAKEFSLKYQDSIIIRQRDTKAQYKKTREERFENLKNAFRACGDLSGQKILVVDDICTTGATFLEAARALYSAGAQEVRCFSLAKEF